MARAKLGFIFSRFVLALPFALITMSIAGWRALVRQFTKFSTALFEQNEQD